MANGDKRQQGGKRMWHRYKKQMTVGQRDNTDITNKGNWEEEETREKESKTRNRKEKKKKRRM